MAEIIDRELGWDDEIEREGQEFTILPDGDYNFTVTAFERARHEPKRDASGKIIGKMPACNKAILTLEFENPSDPGNPVPIKHNLFLHTRTEGLISDFLIGIGQKKHGEPTKPKWGEMVGSKGRAKLTTRTWRGQDGQEYKSNNIKKFYEPEDKPAFTPGAF